MRLWGRQAGRKSLWTKSKPKADTVVKPLSGLRLYFYCLLLFYGLAYCYFKNGFTWAELKFVLRSQQCNKKSTTIIQQQQWKSEGWVSLWKEAGLQPSCRGFDPQPRAWGEGETVHLLGGVRHVQGTLHLLTCSRWTWWSCDAGSKDGSWPGSGLSQVEVKSLEMFTRHPVLRSLPIGVWTKIAKWSHFCKWQLFAQMKTSTRLPG